ncbi:SOS response-associated peptidase [Parvularcula sp. LCG005]|uniref:SOS response-associated peptidase n=1 Tax=Parvularcula sp. LCG005 TaxID=3078805 RepID=UPI002942B1FE|nr:SOS response-associated peptidase [Parvularcula sp. LCG005]WOI54734.1 SOS response-associated peptidase [Parvularcula sp. LCG005]
MNARYVIKEDPYGLGNHFGIAITNNFPARYNIAPSQPVPIIRQGPDGRREYTLVRWGFVPSWDRAGQMFKRSIVNIRSESAPEKNSFRHAWRRRHCLFPMNGFYEWLDGPDGKQPYLHALAENMPLFSLAGLWEDWLGEDGSEMTTAAFLTRDGIFPLTGEVDRVPVFVPPDRYDDWLHADETDDSLAREIVGLPDPDFIHWPVSQRVNSWKPDDEGLIQPILLNAQQSLF